MHVTRWPLCASFAEDVSLLLPLLEWLGSFAQAVATHTDALEVPGSLHDVSAKKVARLSHKPISSMMAGETSPL